MLDTAARFHRYSLNNLILIAVQAPGATRIAGFRTWQSLGRQVRKGERGIAILAPCTYRTKGADNAEQAGGTPGTTTPGTDGGGGAEATPVPAGRQVRGFRRVYVFDISSDRRGAAARGRPRPADGGGRPGCGTTSPRRSPRTGSPWSGATAAARTATPTPPGAPSGSAATSTMRRPSKTVAHELGHLQCGHVTDLPTYATCRGRCEVEAESVAYIVTAAHGLDAGGYTFAYVATWAGGDPATVQDAADTVTTAARAILDRLDTDTPGADSETAAGGSAAA